jgi:hypothetical protein
MKLRVDFFKAKTGKWYTVEELELGEVVDASSSNLDRTALFNSFLTLRLLQEVEGKVRTRYSGMTAVCLDWGGYPILVTVPGPS